MQFCIKFVVLNRSYLTNTQPICKLEPENLRFAPIIYFKFSFCIFNRYIQIVPVVRITSPELHPMQGCNEC